MSVGCSRYKPQSKLKSLKWKKSNLSVALAWLHLTSTYYHSEFADSYCLVLTHAILNSFCSEVTIHGDGTQLPQTITGDKLYDYDQLLETGKAHTIRQPIGTSKSSLSTKLFSLEEGGATALGPALAVCVGIAGENPGSEVTFRARVLIFSHFSAYVWIVFLFIRLSCVQTAFPMWV